MKHLGEVLKTSPSNVEQAAELVESIAVVADCMACCNACADACMGEEQVGRLRDCVRRLLDCAGVCSVAVAALCRPHGGEREHIAALLEACESACRSCATECEKHAQRHEHCRACGESCRECEETCGELIAALEGGRIRA